MLNKEVKERKYNIHEYENYTEKEAILEKIHMYRLAKTPEWEIRERLIDKISKEYIYLLPTQERPVLDKIERVEYKTSDDPFDHSYGYYYKAYFKNSEIVAEFGESDIDDVLKDYSGIITEKDIRKA
jgi:hypothetical protein